MMIEKIEFSKSMNGYTETLISLLAKTNEIIEMVNHHTRIINTNGISNNPRAQEKTKRICFEEAMYAIRNGKEVKHKDQCYKTFSDSGEPVIIATYKQIKSFDWEIIDG